MTETTELITIDARWAPYAERYIEDSELTIGAWSTDEELDAQVAAVANVYSADSGDLHDLLHAVRSYLRDAVVDAGDR
ncbi:hypothetical protein [Mycobacteroides abscessus]|uniref:hypothetical protein n=1 Tax=Mycobacteroides abscessus TaxID=36809 RepID=UPI0002D3463E|nr:hypothetical protein [Mycobacteroides abscessus]